MKINYFNSPVPHLVVDGFLGARTNQDLLGMIATVEDRMIDAEIIDHGVRRTDHGFRQNLNLWLDTFDTDTLGIMSIFTEKFFDTRVLEAVNNCPELNHATNTQSRNHNMVLSRFHTHDFYKWHTDGGGHATWNYFCYREPRQFKGGDFELSNALYQEPRSDTKIIECVNDRLIIFPAKYQHQVIPVVSESDLTGLDCRHSIQVFFS